MCSSHPAEHLCQTTFDIPELFLEKCNNQYKCYDRLVKDHCIDVTYLLKTHLTNSSIALYDKTKREKYSAKSVRLITASDSVVKIKSD